jgi:hypothetical protein
MADTPPGGGPLPVNSPLDAGLNATWTVVQSLWTTYAVHGDALAPDLRSPALTLVLLAFLYVCVKLVSWMWAEIMGALRAMIQRLAMVAILVWLARAASNVDGLPEPLATVSKNLDLYMAMLWKFIRP